MPYDKEANQAACVRSTITNNPHNRDLSSREVDRAVERGMTIIKSSPNQTYGQIADSAVGIVRSDRGK